MKFKVFMASILVGLVSMATISTANAAGVRVIVNSSSSVSSMTLDQVSDIYKERVTTWSNGNKIKSYSLGSGNPTEQAFCDKVYGQPAEAVSADRKSVAAQNRAVNQPKVKRSTRSIMRAVSKDASAIGYVSSEGDLRDGVKVVLEF